MIATVTNILIKISTVKVETMHFLSNILMLAFLELVVPFYFALHKSDGNEKSCPDHVHFKKKWHCKMFMMVNGLLFKSTHSLNWICYSQMEMLPKKTSRKPAFTCASDVN